MAGQPKWFTDAQAAKGTGAVKEQKPEKLTGEARMDALEKLLDRHGIRLPA
jgi:hypothetical protein